MVCAEPLSSPSESGHDLVEHEKDPVLVAEGAETLQVPVGRHEHPRRPGDRLHEDRRDVVRTLVPDHFFDVRESFLHVAAEDRPIRIGVKEVHDAGDPGFCRPATAVTAERHRSLRLPME